MPAEVLRVVTDYDAMVRAARFSLACRSRCPGFTDQRPWLLLKLRQLCYRYCSRIAVVQLEDLEQLAVATVTAHLDRSGCRARCSWAHLLLAA